MSVRRGVPSTLLSTKTNFAPLNNFLYDNFLTNYTLYHEIFHFFFFYKIHLD